MTQKVQTTNQTAVGQYILDLAGRLADSEHDNQQRLDRSLASNRTQLNKQQRDEMIPAIIKRFGLRTGFATPIRGVRIETNFLSMTFPQRIYVYDVEMVRGLDRHGNSIMVKKQWDRLKILQTITFVRSSQPGYAPYTDALYTNLPCWVSDGSLIWSTVGLFNHDPRQTPGPLVSTAAQAINYENEMGKQSTIEQVNVTFRQHLDLTRPVGELFFNATAASFRDSDPSILTRGLNAFFTRFIRDRSDPAVSDLMSAFVRVCQNKSFSNFMALSLTERIL